MPDSAERFTVAVAVVAVAGLEGATLVLSRGVAPMTPAVIYAGYSVVQVLAGAAVVNTHPRHRVGWLLVVTALFTAAVSDCGTAYGQRGAHHGWPAADVAQAAGWSAWVVSAIGLSLLFLWFPDGRVSGRARALPWLCAAGAVLDLPGWALNPRLGSEFVEGVNPYAIGSTESEALFLTGLVLVTGTLLASVAAFIARFRRSRGTERLQLTWMAFAASLAGVVLPTSALLWTVWPPIQLAAAVSLTLLPVAATVAILRYHLYDVDLVVSRTVAYAAISGLLVATYAAVVLLVGTQLSSPVAAAAGAFVVAIAFRPLRDRVQAAVDRRFRRARYETRRVMLDFVDAIRRGEDTVDHLEDRLRTAVGEPTCFVAFVDERGDWLDARGLSVTREVNASTSRTPSGSGARLTSVVVHPGEAERAVGEALDAGRLAFEIAALQVDLRRQVDELDSARARVIAIADQERRRLARDLHDGAQQRLVAIGLTLRHVQHELGGTAPTVLGELDGAVAELGNAIDELRELAGGLRPSSLDSGLQAALDDLAARTPTPVRVNVTAERFSPELETAAYFIAAEGLTNAVKHAEAGQILLEVAHELGQLVVAVHDDGQGGADLRRGTGLAGLADRARSHGGHLEISSVPGYGTRLRATLPCA